MRAGDWLPTAGTLIVGLCAGILIGAVGMYIALNDYFYPSLRAAFVLGYTLEAFEHRDAGEHTLAVEKLLDAHTYDPESAVVMFELGATAHEMGSTAFGRAIAITCLRRAVAVADGTATSGETDASPFPVEPWLDLMPEDVARARELLADFEEEPAPAG